jgi:hypothetical protein
MSTAETKQIVFFWTHGLISRTRCTTAIPSICRSIQAPETLIDHLSKSSFIFQVPARLFLYWKHSCPKIVLYLCFPT